METPLPNSFIHVGGYRRLDPQQIVRLVADRNYTLIYEASDRKFIVSTTLRVIEERLRPFGFVRISRGIVINPAYVRRIWQDGTLQLTDGTQLYPSRRRQGVLKNSIVFSELDSIK